MKAVAILAALVGLAVAMPAAAPGGAPIEARDADSQLVKRDCGDDQCIDHRCVEVECSENNPRQCVNRYYGTC